MKRRIFAVVVALTLCLLAGCSAGNTAETPESVPPESVPPESVSPEVPAAVLDIATTQAFTEEAVSAEDAERILLAGINAPSAMNGQPWHFTAVTDSAVLRQIAEDMSAGMPGRFPGASAPNPGTPPADDGASAGMPATPPADDGASAGMPVAPPADDGASAGMPATPPADDSASAGMPVAPPADDGASAGTPPAMPPAGNGAKAGIADAPLAIVVSCRNGSELDAGLACQNMSVAAVLMGYGTKIVTSPTIALNGANQERYRELLGIPEDYAAAAVLLVGRASQESDAVTSATPRKSMEETVSWLTP